MKEFIQVIVTIWVFTMVILIGVLPLIGIGYLISVLFR